MDTNSDIDSSYFAEAMFGPDIEKKLATIPESVFSPNHHPQAVGLPQEENPTTEPRPKINIRMMINTRGEAVIVKNGPRNAQEKLQWMGLPMPKYPPLDAFWLSILPLKSFK
ncbi:uncharacterized protein HMPREF1541_03745 [Cyphellophora europaea CBS 101466]|uniref:Uncharacterized protein n=1 Tax=Cyphellophora europaea (strain CBS 101466) TaxID=1220924 RepID=W2S173_CYPE1|nr:uncharacterized protein HMPREF1541_03745 [Cyphellophora europaea CBS 101466]ETN41808.1 hypothetical protein HMPREF1541_03745 [Cyphellophora europaea CBS 101466]